MTKKNDYNAQQLFKLWNPSQKILLINFILPTLNDSQQINRKPQETGKSFSQKTTK